jgi:hypothetical protein
VNFSRESTPQSLRRLLDAIPEADDLQLISQREGSLTTSARGSHVRIGVRLCTWWALAARLVPEADRLDRVCDWLEAASEPASYALRSAVLLGAIYTLYSVAGALISHGVLARLLGGTQ